MVKTFSSFFGSSRANPSLGPPQPKPSKKTLRVLPECCCSTSLILSRARSVIFNMIFVLLVYRPIPAINFKYGLKACAADGHAIRPDQPQVKPLPAGALQAPPLEPAAEVSDTVRCAALPQAGHSILSRGRRWIFSNSFPQFSHWYSKMGIGFTPFNLIIHIFICFLTSWQGENCPLCPNAIRNMGESRNKKTTRKVKKEPGGFHGCFFDLCWGREKRTLTDGVRIQGGV